MSQKPLRNDQTCLNCEAHLNGRFCAQCGQENIEPRQSFGHLIKEFFEDFTHYEGHFWLTIRYLLFSPAKLTREYLAGKRKKFVPPIRLYIFISFVVFLLPHLLPHAGTEQHPLPDETQQTDTTKNGMAMYYSADEGLVMRVPYKNIAALDSIENATPEHKRLDPFNYWISKKTIELRRYNAHELLDKFTETIQRTFPKALFLYMPLFALIIWIFHNKKRWYYFDHAIFTLHYFSLVLLIYGLLELFNYPLSFVLTADDRLTTYLMGIPVIAAIYILYLFIAHQKMYAEPWYVSTIKTTFILLINLSLFMLLLIGLIIYALSVLH